MDEIVLVGEAVAGESAAARKKLESLINAATQNLFDIGEQFFKVKDGKLYQPEFNTFRDYIRSLKFKESRARYLVRIFEVTKELKIPKCKYEPLGTTRMREITSLDPKGEWINPENGDKYAIKDFILKFIQAGETISIDDLRRHVRTLKGLIGENDLMHITFTLKRIGYENNLRPALEKVKLLMGTKPKDEEGNAELPSDGAALEIMAIIINADETLTLEKFETLPDPEEKNEATV
jgi:hypothetical protein